jgi:hypothetical protein
MPYIKTDKREIVKKQLCDLITSVVDACSGDVSALPGVLNYCVTALIKSTYRLVTNKSVLSYADHNSAIGMLECAKMEFYRRDTSPYEDEKIRENGDVEKTFFIDHTR